MAASHAAQDSGILPDPLSPPGSTPGRVWQACQSCRRKKVKCDGKSPCYNCSSRGHSCVFPEAKDHASVSRYYASSLEARCQHMDFVCQRLEGLAKTLSQATDVLSRASSSSRPGGRLSEDLIQAANVLRSFPGGLPQGAFQDGQQAPLETPATGQLAFRDPAAIRAFDDESSDYSDQDGGVMPDAEDEDVEEDGADEEEEDTQDQAGALVTDSYGRLRFVGGATNKMLIDAAKAVSPLTHTHTPASGVAQESGETTHNTDVELPLFIRGRVWPELPYLPKPEQLSRPPQYVSDILVGLYFDKLHYTFPVIFKPHFMEKYSRMLRGGSTPSASQDKEFLMVFFAVCACASGLLPSTSERGFPGIEYYEKALLLHYASPGQASWENVQCLALLAMCAASWNTLTRSWSLAGQAVRSAMDIGLHLSNRYMKAAGAKRGASDASERLRQQVARRTWWSIFCMERVVSICLGRPMAVQERDCSCELPLDLSDEDLERHCSSVRAGFVATGTPQPLTGFLAFARLCQLSGRIQQLGSPLRLRRPSSHSAEKTRKYLARVRALDHSLRGWLETLPDTVRFSANEVNGAATGDSGLVMCVIIFIMHAGSLLNLYRDLVYYLKRFGGSQSSTSAEMADATAQCMSAAKSCINAAELVRDLVPPSHYLAICVHFLTLSGVALLRMSPKQLEPGVIIDAEKCAGYLQNLEFRWSGASRSRAIIEHLIAECRLQQQQQAIASGQGTATPAEQRPAVMLSNKRVFAEMDGESGFQMEDILWGDVLPWFDVNDPGGSGSSFVSWSGL